jgi:hypothetical protein
MPESSERERSDAPARSAVARAAKGPISRQNKEEPAPEAFDPSLDEAQVLKAVEPFIA